MTTTASKQTPSDEACCSSTGLPSKKGNTAVTSRSWCTRLCQQLRVPGCGSSGWGHARSQARSQEAQTAIDQRLLLFWPWFVESAFQKHYYRNTLSLCDSVCVPLDAIIHLAILLLSLFRLEVRLLYVLPGVLTSLTVLAVRHLAPDWYMDHRTTVTVLRRLMILPVLALELLRQPVRAAGNWHAASMHLVVLSGSLHNSLASACFLSPWWMTVPQLAVGAAVLASAAPTTCNNILAGPQPHAGWRAAAALLDRAALNIYSSSLQRPDMAHAVCCTTLNTVLVALSCLSGYLVHWFERQQRLRYKAQLPPAVAAMQGHLYSLPRGLIAAQALLLLLHPAMVIAWVALGAWHGLMVPPGRLEASVSG